MNNLSQYTFVCEFRIKLGEKLNQNHIDFLNNVAEAQSINAGTYSIGECGIDGEVLTGRYYLKSDIIPQSDSEYQDVLRNDLVLLIKRDLNFPMDGRPELESSQTLLAIIMPTLQLVHGSGSDKKVYHSDRTNMYYIISDDGYCDGVFHQEEQAVANLND